MSRLARYDGERSGYGTWYLWIIGTGLWFLQLDAPWPFLLLWALSVAAQWRWHHQPTT